MTTDRNETLQTERIILRDFIEEDWQAVHEYGSEPQAVKYMPFGPNTEQDTKSFIKTVLDSQKEKPRLSYNFALVNKLDNRLVGSCRIKTTNTEYKEGEIGYILNRNFWNRGYMTEAARKVVSFGFEELGLHRIYATCDPENTGSYRVMEKIGMQREGCLREYKLFKGVWRDFLLYSILKKEWQRQKENLIIKSANDSQTVIEYLELGSDEFDIIGPLWQKLYEHHKVVSRNFKDNYQIVTFDMRKKQLLEKTSEGALRLDTARNKVTGKNIGYCISSLTREKLGEIESIYVEKEYRGSGIGDRLMIRAIDWLEVMSAMRKILGVGEGNESVLEFYRRYNFYPKTTVLEQKPAKNW